MGKNDNPVFKWGRGIIEKLSNVVKTGTKFFAGHGKNTNSHDGRQSLGEVVASYVKEIKGKLANVVIGFFPDKESVQDMDVISMEASINTDIEDTVTDIEKVSGIAMASSDKESPAFPGAVRLASIQCFAQDTINNTGGEPRNSHPGEGRKTVTFNEVKDAVKNMNIWPHQLFSEEDLRNDNSFGPMFTELSDTKKELETLQTENATVKEKLLGFEKTQELATAKTAFDALIKESQLTDMQKAFINRNANLNSLEDYSNESMTTYLDTLKTEFAENAKIFGGAGDGDKIDSGGNGEMREETNIEDALNKIMKN